MFTNFYKSNSFLYGLPASSLWVYMSCNEGNSGCPKALIAFFQRLLRLMDMYHMRMQQHHALKFKFQLQLNYFNGYFDYDCVI